MQFLAQQFFAPIGTLLVSYPIFRSIEMRFLQHGGDEDIGVWAWRWTAIILPVLVGFRIGLFIQDTWPSAHLTGRFVGVIPTLWFVKDFAAAVSSLSYVQALDTTLRDAGGLEMWIGAVFYGFGLEWAYRRNNSKTGIRGGRPEVTPSPTTARLHS